MSVFFETPAVKLHQGNCLDILPELPSGSVQTCVTSPPYWGLRDYGQPDQLGLESSPDDYIARMVEVFREVRRVLRDDGTLWLNLGDSYAGGGTIGRNDTDAASLARRAEKYNTGQQSGSFVGNHGSRQKAPNLKPKDLVGIPWRVAFALQSDGWYLRQDIIWHKPNPMPESVTDRCTKSHEYIFLLSKSARYFYDAEAVKEAASNDSGFAKQRAKGENQVHKKPGHVYLDKREECQYGLNTAKNTPTRNRRSVWTVPTKPYSGAHFAVFPPKLIEPCILAGSPPEGVVLDPFAGSGTTLQVAKELGRKAIGIELNPDYCRLVAERCQQLTIFECPGHPLATPPGLFLAISRG